MTTATGQRKLDTTKSTKLSELLLRQFSNKVVGQEKAVSTLVDMFDAHQAGIQDANHPAGVVLFLGPTGTGKTHVAEVFAESLLGKKQALLRIDCAEFQHSHEIAKLIGSPPGYLGHRETHPLLTQEALDQYHTESLKVTILLFDEVEKASDALWSLLLGILDKATLTLGDNRKVNFSNCIIVMTSNLGSRDMADRGIGFVDPDASADDERKAKQAMSAAKSNFTPEFMNRIQHFVVFKTLTKEQMKGVLAMELYDLKLRLFLSSSDLIHGKTLKSPRFTLMVSSKAKAVLLEDGYDPNYGARHLKRAIDRRIQIPLARLLGSKQIHEGDTVIVDDSGKEAFDFFCQGAIVLNANGENATPIEDLT